ncbi:Histone H2B like protein [Aduncisulcus paluster]|nr:Histone H2B like protein [Aduncisulcus paluster]GKT36100.1 Histone H2B like protein [Aduncisulcus paluster]|eukprot:gnl/Carplike_NY0171/853_a1173_1749.p1 GENE.gnl/Carplike_NY0171/853_a1173_1749~~gnl/Carplike_NY0171/853_a1173_1749.p1  ORF type:complete len:134 (-),score=60.20 gnl/Carplike_NY0171/853_a1173_1749:476-877(-)
MARGEKGTKSTKTAKTSKTESKGTGEKRTSKKKRIETFHSYIYRVLRDVHGEKFGITNKGMAIMNSMVNDLFTRVASRSSELVRMNKRTTLTADEVATAVKLEFPGELAMHAVGEGNKAVSKYFASKKAGDTE